MSSLNNSQQSERCFQKAAHVLENLGKVPIIKEFRADPDSANPALQLNVSVWNQSLLLRVKELGDASISLWQQNHLVSAAILTRCLLETVALYYHIKTIIEDAINKARQVDEVAEELWRVGRGRDRRNLKLLYQGAPRTNRDYEAIEHKKFREALTQKSEALKYTYSELSEYVHPNASGTSDAYANPNQKNLSFVFDGKFDHISRNVGYVLQFGVTLFEHCWSQMKKLIPQFVETL